VETATLTTPAPRATVTATSRGGAVRTAGPTVRQEEIVTSAIDSSRDHREFEPPNREAEPWRHRGVQRTLRYAFIRPSGSAARRSAIALGLVAGAALLASSGVIHLQLWASGYRTIPTIGPLFLLQGIAGVLLAVVLLLWHRLLVVVTGAAFMVATVGGLLVSVKFGLFGFMDTFAAPYAGLSAVLESAGAVVLGVVGTALVVGHSR
jgi:hypothetical protein